jgi:hypothetical protein
MSDIAEDDNTAFVVFVPPNNGDKTFESCLRMGAPPTSSTADEKTTYNDAVSKSDNLSQLSAETYNLTAGIALITPGTINLVAAGGVNSTSGSVTNSTNGSSYTVTQDGSPIISATYTHKGIDTLGLWSTVSFNSASTVAVNTVPVQASFGTALAAYSLQGPVVLSNQWGLMWNSTIGWSVAAQLARVVQVGWRTVVSYNTEGVSNQYYTAKQAQSTAAGFQWTVPIQGKYADFDALQLKYCKLINKLALATDALAVVYSAIGLIGAECGSPSAVHTWLDFAEPMAILCSAANGILAGMGLWLGARVDSWAADPDTPTDPKAPPPDPNPHNVGATQLTLGDGTTTLQTGEDKKAPAVNLNRESKQITLSTDDPDKGLTLRLDGDKGGTWGKAGKAMISLTDDSAILKYGKDAQEVSVQVSAKGVLLKAPNHSVNVTSSEITITGQSITIEGVTTAIDTLSHQIAATQKGLEAANKAAADAADAAAEAKRVAANAAYTAGKAKEAADKVTAGAGSGSPGTSPGPANPGP